jgi:hypothetical protein
MYVRNKIVKVLQEQPTPPADPMADPMATPPADTEKPAEETSATKAESAAGIFTTALDSVYLESIALGVEIALKPLINQFKKNKDQHEATKQAIYTTLANANIKYVRPATTDHTKDNLPDQDIPTSDASDLA